MPSHQTWNVDGGWFEGRISTKPTDLDSTGCDGIYVESIRIKSAWRVLWFVLTHPLKLLRAINAVVTGKINRWIEKWEGA